MDAASELGVMMCKKSNMHKRPVNVFLFQVPQRPYHVRDEKREYSPESVGVFSCAHHCKEGCPH